VQTIDYPFFNKFLKSR